MSLGSRISVLRNKRGLSQEELAKVLKIGKSTLGMYETDRREPSHEMSSKIASYFDVSLDWLITGEIKESNLMYEDAEMLQKFNLLKEKDQKYILELMDRLNNN